MNRWIAACALAMVAWLTPARAGAASGGGVAVGAVAGSVVLDRLDAPTLPGLPLPVHVGQVEVVRPPITATTRVIPGSILLKPAAGVPLARLRLALATASGWPAAQVRHVRSLVLGWELFLLESAAGPGIDEETTIALADTLPQRPEIALAAAEWVMRPSRTPNDPFFGNMWHLETIGSRAAWDVTVGRSSNRVGVVDTGTFFGHEDLSGKAAQGFDFISDPFIANDGGGRDSDPTDPGDAADCDGDGRLDAPNSFHGTHVGGTILANGNNGIGITGINWTGQLVTGRALGRCGGSTVDINEAVAWMAGFQVSPAPTLAVAERPKVINLSLGATRSRCDSFSNDVFNAVSGRGHLIVVAAGNESTSVSSPANCPAAIAVAAHGPRNNRRLAPYSNFGAEIAIVAPGGDFSRGALEEGVLSASHPSVSILRGSIPYSFEQGTSMAAPHVAGVLSLMVDVNPGLSRATAVQLLTTAGAESCDNCSGKPILRADLAVAAAAGTAVTTRPGDSCAGTGFCSGGQTCVTVEADTICLLDCTTDSGCTAPERCVPLQSGGAVCFDDGSEPPVVGDCDLRRGNMDCDNGFACRRFLDDNGIRGECVRGEGPNKTGELCERGRDCASGLCDRGVCTVTCDFRCRGGFRCSDEEDSGVPGGLCRAQSCLDDPDICTEEGWDCSYSTAGRYVCAVGPSNYRGFCGSQPGAAVALWGLLLPALWGLRRRRTASAVAAAITAGAPSSSAGTP